MVTKAYTDDEFESLISQYDYKFQKGDLVKGMVCGYDSDGVIVDIGAKTSASVPEREARIDTSVSVEDTLKKGEVYEFLIVKEEDEDGRFTLSHKKVAMAYAWKELEELKVQDTVFRDGMTMRQILQTWGTNDVVTYDQMYWVRALMRLIDKEKPKCPIIADLRFDHELQYLKEHHWFLVKIEYNVHTDNHVSETEQLGFNPSDFAFVINNNNHSANLDLEADKLLEVYRSQRGQR